MDIDNLTGSIVDACIKIHSTVRPGCFEKVYEEILYFEFVGVATILTTGKLRGQKRKRSKREYEY
jgi:hypothetical protein